LDSANESDLAAYENLWNNALLKYSASGAPRIPVELAGRFLAVEVASADTVALVIEALGYRGSIDITQFQIVAHVLYSAVHSAQEAVFNTDDPSLWADAAPAASKGKHAGQGTDTRDEWLIGTVVRSHGRDAFQHITPVESDIDNQQQRSESNHIIENDQSCTASADGGAGSLDSLGPLGQGLRAFSISMSSHSASSIEKDSPSTASGGKNRADDKASSHWKAFDDAFSQLSVTDTPELLKTYEEKPCLSWALQTSSQLSLHQATLRLTATANTLPGTGISVMDPAERRRCENAFGAKGYAKAGGMDKNQAFRIFSRAKHLQLPIFLQLWRLVDPADSGRLDARRFCLYMHLLQAAVAGETCFPESLNAVQEAALLGDFAPENLNSARPEALPPRSPLHLDTARLGAVFRLDSQGQAPGSSRQQQTRHSACNENNAAAACDSDVDNDDNLSDDADSITSFSSTSRPTSARLALALPPLNIINTARRLSGSLAGGTPKSSRNAAPRATTSIPNLAVPETGAMTNMERAAWAAEAGPGHAALELHFRAAALTQRKLMDHPFVTLSVQDPLGRLVELPQDTHPGIVTLDTAVVDFGNQVLVLKTPLRSLPPGCMLFLELRHWKAEKRRLSTIAWTFVETEMMGERISVI